ncbi:MAG: FkbM family methyltransferase [Candidatus Nanopelagicales bacterium]
MLEASSSLDSRLAATSDSYLRILDATANGVFLYGAGFVGRWSVNYLESEGIPVVGFVDSDELKWGTIINGKRVFSPHDLLVSNAKAVLITSRHAVPAIKKSLSHLPASVMSVDAFVVHHNGREKIEELSSLFSDDMRSLETFNAILLAMLDGDKQVLSAVADSRPFFDRFGFFNRDGEIFVDAGAYVGDSVERFLWSVNGVYRHIHAFEPGPVQFKAMQSRVNRLISEWSLTPESISLLNMGLSAESAVVRVTSGPHPIQTRIENCDPEGAAHLGLEVRTVALDQYFDGAGFTLLKVDVEGSEAELLAGAVKTIAEYRPRIALSVYHFPTDIFTLPLQCRAANANYSFSLGHHSSQLMDTVLYCRDRDD